MKIFSYTKKWIIAVLVISFECLISSYIKNWRWKLNLVKCIREDENLSIGLLFDLLTMHKQWPGTNKYFADEKYWNFHNYKNRKPKTFHY